MQRIFLFELNTAIKDRPKVFQVITLVIFAFSLTMILIGTIARFTDSKDADRQVFRKNQTNQYLNFASSSRLSSEYLQK